MFAFRSHTILKSEIITLCIKIKCHTTLETILTRENITVNTPFKTDQNILVSTNKTIVLRYIDAKRIIKGYV